MHCEFLTYAAVDSIDYLGPFPAKLYYGLRALSNSLHAVNVEKYREERVIARPQGMVAIPKEFQAKSIVSKLPIGDPVKAPTIVPASAKPASDALVKGDDPLGVGAAAVAGQFASEQKMTELETLLPKESNKIKSDFAALVAESEAAYAKSDELRASFEAEYGDILEAGDINIDQNIKNAQSMSLGEWIDAVKSDGVWDYKNSKDLKAQFSEERLDAFGNVHFGMVAAAKGFPLSTSLNGAGGYQVGFQEDGSLMDWLKSPFISTREEAVELTEEGNTWGDNPGDSKNIMEGWQFYHNSYPKGR